MATDPDSRSKQKAMMIFIPIVLLIFALIIAISYWRAEENADDATYPDGDVPADEMRLPDDRVAQPDEEALLLL